MANEPKRHHYLPKAYLEGFSDASGQLWVIDRQESSVRRQPPKVTAVERDFYTLDLTDGPERGAEKLLADTVDGPGIAAIQALEARQFTRERHASSLAMFVAALCLRTPSAKAMNTEMSEGLYRLLDKETVARPTEDLPLEAGWVSAYELKNHLEALRSDERPYHNDFVRMLKIVPSVADVVLQLEWLIAVAPPGKTFVTSDSPVVSSRPVRHNPLLGVGLLTRGAEKTVPLTKHLALVMMDPTAKPSVEVGVIDRARLRSINEQLARSSHRFVCGANHALLTSLLRKTGIGGTPPPARSSIR